MKSKSKPEPRAEKIKAKKLSSTEYMGDEFFADFAAEAKAMFKEQAIIPTGSADSLLEVNGWIPMPEEVAHVMDAPGVPCGLISMVYGLPDSGKTTFANTALKNTQEEKGIAILMKTEDKYSLKRAEVMGIDVKKMLILRPRTIEEVGDKVQDIMSIVQRKGWSNRKVTIVWDSLAATPCAAELNEKRTSFSMDAAKAIRGMLRKVSALIKESNIAFLIINQVYDNTNSFGDKTTPYGGKGAIYHSAIIMSFAKLGRIRPIGKKDGDFCGINAKIEVKKNHLGQPFKTGEFHIDHKGFIFDRSAEVAPSFLKDLSDIEEEDDDETEPGDSTIHAKKESRTPLKGGPKGKGSVRRVDGLSRKKVLSRVRGTDARSGEED